MLAAWENISELRNRNGFEWLLMIVDTEESKHATVQKDLIATIEEINEVNEGLTDGREVASKYKVMVPATLGSITLRFRSVFTIPALQLYT